MLKNPIPKVVNKFQYRAIGIINGKFIPHTSEQINRGYIIDNEGEKIETVVLGKALSLLKKHIDLKKSYFWIVYPKNKNTQNLHLQVAGIWDPYQLNDFPNDSSKSDFSKLLEELDLKNNYFSVRGELVFVNTQKKEVVIKICSDSKLKNLKKKNFKLIIKGELSLQLLNSFVSLDVMRDGNSLELFNYEVIEKKLN
tara:strand:- start:220 stop:810 length:591 start_codon:yes stop_codon:yes gene_type:complete